MTTAAGDSLNDRLAATVVRLLETYGAVITLKRYSTAFDSSTQKAVRTETASLSVNGVFTNQRKMPQSGTRIEANERVVVLDGNAGPRLKDCLSLPAGYSPTSGGAMPGCIVSSDFAAVWTIEEVVTIAPSNQPLAYIVRVAK